MNRNMFDYAADSLVSNENKALFVPIDWQLGAS